MDPLWRRAKVKPARCRELCWVDTFVHQPLALHPAPRRREILAQYLDLNSNAAHVALKLAHQILGTLGTVAVETESVTNLRMAPIPRLVRKLMKVSSESHDKVLEIFLVA